MKLLLVVLTGIVVSFFYFPFEFTSLKGVNTKIMLAVLGVPLMGYHMLLMRELRFSKELVNATFIAAIFSLISFFSVDYNNSDDFVYATYFLSMCAWFFASYVVCWLISNVHGYISIRLVANYLLAVCVVQCFFALIIDFVPPVKAFVDMHFTIGITSFLNHVDRLYGIGAALDVAGVRFSAVLIIISFLLTKKRWTEDSKIDPSFYIIGFFIVSVIGNMISRTTLVGVGIGLGYFFLVMGVPRMRIRYSSLKIWKLLIGFGAPLILISVYLYNTYKEAYTLFRFGFEGFFNWAETGIWRTDSTDRLNTVMWIWPEVNDYKTWLIGDAVFSNWEDVGTDIGYCRFIFYCGLTGLVAFSFFFVYLTYGLSARFQEIKNVFYLLLLLLFVNWLKVSTDIFLVYALFLSMGSPYLYGKFYKG